MRKKLTLSLTVIILIIMGVFFMRNNSTPSVIVLDAIGESLPDVQKKSSYEFPVAMDINKYELKGNNGFFLVEPFILKYRPNEPMGFTLSAGRFGYMGLSVGHVTNIEVNPQLEYSSLNVAIEKTNRITQMLEKKGWQRITDNRLFFNNLTDEEILAYFEKWEGERASKFVRAWEYEDGTTIRMLLDRNYIAKDHDSIFSRDKDGFLLEVRIENEKIANHYIDLGETYARVERRKRIKKDQLERQKEEIPKSSIDNDVN